MGDRMREEFEAWHGGLYRGHHEEIAWACWQAAWAASRKVAIKDVCSVFEDRGASMSSPAPTMVNREEAVRAIRAMGGAG